MRWLNRHAHSAALTVNSECSFAWFIGSDSHMLSSRISLSFDVRWSTSVMPALSQAFVPKSSSIRSIIVFFEFVTQRQFHLTRNMSKP
jgi:hypothetical protein